MSEPPNADYERGWQDAIASLNPAGTIERARLNLAVTGLQRRFAEMVQQLADDQERVARALEALDAPHEQAVGICGDRMPALVTGEAGSVVCELPHGHAGWHGAPPGTSGPRWTAEPDVREVGRCFKTVDEWLIDPEFAGTEILDWDGWRTPDAPSRETPITRDEFWARLAMCTVRPRLVGEQGPELRDLAPGTTIHPQPEATDG